MSTSAAPPNESARTRRAISNTLKGSAGNLIEWYDLYVYAAFSSYFSTYFFNQSDPAQAQIDAYLTFALTFLMRPVGSWFFGRYADQRGRKAALTLSVTLMCVGSLIMCLLPGLNQIGIWSTVLLYLTRLLQGFSVGGEYGTSATYMSEAATSGRRGFFSSFQYVTLVGGQVLALLTLVILQNVLSPEDLTAWGWRIPFFIGAIAALTVLWLRRTMDETISTEQISAANSTADAAGHGLAARPGSLKLLFTQHWRPFLVVVFLTMGGTMAFYLFTTYILSFMNNVSHIPKTQTSVINFWALFVFMLLQPVFGLLSDRIGRKAQLIAFGVLGAVFTWPIMSTLAGVTDPMVAFWLDAGRPDHQRAVHLGERRGEGRDVPGLHPGAGRRARLRRGELLVRRHGALHRRVTLGGGTQGVAVRVRDHRDRPVPGRVHLLRAGQAQPPEVLVRRRRRRVRFAPAALSRGRSLTRPR
ncbi:hypothetical protein GCM10011512_05180 [Tersicoccus solisilvae]|uniref:Major facilitator superfamily (MFS) profile domain-containing protein n=1 Tax=Tersicoccus solisilvae TaxID=1882339 RepID=A0ABQ1NPJ9_9MICC|nr:MFS transporter [Tersicoccus solisilvae]GGC81464.1 hypothetical protein GCM10011512_05180 [Tersicoccus solisilvae]